MRLVTLAVSVLAVGCYAVADEEVTDHQNVRHVGKQRTDRHSHTSSRRLGKTTGKERLGKTGKEQEYDDDEEIMTPYSAGKKKRNKKHKNETNRNNGGKGNKLLRFGVPDEEYSKAEKTSETSEGGDSKSDKMINYSDTIEGGDSKADKTEGGDSKADKMINYSDIMDDKMINYSEMINYSDILVEGGDSKADKMINYSDLVDDYDESDSKAGKLSEEEGSAKAGKTSSTAEGKARKLLKLR